MHHPGPPRFAAVGDEVELAPRDPDPDETYSWTLQTTPDDSHATLGDDPVEHLRPDEPGTYLARLSAPDRTHDLTVRAFPGDRAVDAPAGAPSGESGRSGSARPGRSGMSGVSGSESGALGESGRGADDAEAGGGRPRLTLSASVEGDTLVVRADPQPHPDAGETAADLTVEFVPDDRDAVDAGAVDVDDRTWRLPVEAVEGQVRVHAVAVGEHGYSVPDTVDVSRTAPDGGAAAEAADTAGAETVSVSHPYEPPTWGEDSVIYEVYVRTFPGRDSDLDGDRTVFDAIRGRLDYIADLGVDAVWLTPVLQNDHAPHGYNITDFFSLAEDLGTRTDYERLIDAAHDRGLRVLFDLVCNHSGRAHPHFQAAVADPDSEYREWYEWRNETEPETYFDWEYIANFDFTHLPVRRHLLDAVDEWAPLVDGFRIDMAWAVPNGFWREVHDRLNERDSEFLLLDETIPYIADFQGGCFDVHFDSTTYAALRRVGNGESAESVLGAVDERAKAGFPDHAGFMLYAENHDETRYLVECGRPAAEAALGALFTLPGAPLVYAGQEFGERSRRDELVWSEADDALRGHVEGLAAARDELPALAAAADLSRTDYEVVDGRDDRVVAYQRCLSSDGADADAVVVVLNFGESPATVTADAVADPTDLVTGESAGTGDGLAVDSVAVFPAGENTGR